jgi:hypothetical protein
MFSRGIPLTAGIRSASTDLIDLRIIGGFELKKIRQLKDNREESRNIDSNRL